MTQILLVEDDEDIRTLLRYLLEDAGYTVLEASDVPEARQVLVAAREVLVVLLDYLLPGLDGMSLLEDGEAWRATGLPHTYLLITASPQSLTPAVQARLLALRIPVVPKPFEVETLLHLVKRSATQLVSVRLDKESPSHE
jgi:two-component system, NtrC family, nitrogen regulation response regulator NtrX